MDLQKKISNIMGQQYAKVDSDDNLKDLASARKEIEESGTGNPDFPERIKGNGQLVWKFVKKAKTLMGDTGYFYRPYIKGHQLSGGSIGFTTREQLDAHISDYVLPISLYNKYRNLENKEEELDEVTGAASAGAYMGPLFVSPLKKGKKVETNEDTELKPPPPTEEEISKFTKIKKQEVDEVTDSSSSGSYETPFFLAKNEKNWRGNKKTQIPGGKFVKVKDKCKTYPYCNQGINALQLSESSNIHKHILKHLEETFGLEEQEVTKRVNKRMKESLFRKRMREMNNQRLNKSELKNKKNTK